MHGQSAFIDPAAVEAWDAWFRWRDRGRLRDIAVEATWQRTAKALATTEPSHSAWGFEAALMRAFDSWQLLLDERVMATAGTGAADWPHDDLVAVLNAAVFIRDRFSPRARFDLIAFGATAEIAVKALDGAAILAAGQPSPMARQRIGVIGLSDALELLGLRYDSAAGRTQAGRIGYALAEGCFRGAIRSAREHGAVAGTSGRLLDAATGRRFPIELLDEAARRGLRHQCLTAITSQPHLALFANNVADALDPLVGERSLYVIASTEQTRAVRSSGYALTLRRAHSAADARIHPSTQTSAHLNEGAQLAMRQALQPWIDGVIAYPLAGAAP